MYPSVQYLIATPSALHTLQRSQASEWLGCVPKCTSVYQCTPELCRSGWCAPVCTSAHQSCWCAPVGNSPLGESRADTSCPACYPWQHPVSPFDVLLILSTLLYTCCKHEPHHRYLTQKNKFKLKQMQPLTKSVSPFDKVLTLSKFRMAILSKAQINPIFTQLKKLLNGLHHQYLTQNVIQTQINVRCTFQKPVFSTK